MGCNNVRVKNNVKKLRKAQGMSQEQLAVLIKIGRSTISEIEAGKHMPKIDIALLLAEALKCRVEDLFILEGDKDSK